MTTKPRLRPPSPARFHLLLLKLPRKSWSLTSSSLLAAREVSMGEAAAELDMLAACGLAALPNRRSKSLSRNPRPAAQAAEPDTFSGSDVGCYNMEVDIALRPAA